MSMPYSNQLHAISEMLSNSAQEIVQEGYDALFTLWMENADSSDFIQDFIPIAVEHENTIQELKNRLKILSTQDQITDTFLQKQLKNLTSEVLTRKSDTSKDDKQLKADQLGTIAPEKLKTKDVTAEGYKKKQENILHSEIVWGKLIWALIFSIIIIITISSSIYLLPRVNPTVDCSTTNGLEVDIDYPKYIANGDTEEIQLTIKNVGNTEVNGSVLINFNGAKVQLKDKSKIYFEDLDDSELQPPTVIRFELVGLHKPIAGQRIIFNAVIMGNDIPCPSKEFYIDISPIYGLRKFVGLLWSVVAVTLTGIFMDRIKEGIEKLLSFFK